MKWVVIGAHLLRDDIDTPAEPIAAGDLFLSGLPIPDEQPLGDRDLLLRVARVRAALLDRATFIAVRYGFAINTHEEAAAKCSPHLARWRENLERHRLEVEMTLKVVAAERVEPPHRRDFTSGGDYLKALHAATKAVQVDPKFREDAERLLANGRWQHRDNQSLELAALVARESVEKVKYEAIALKERFPHVPFLLSGPWPLEVFGE